MCKVPESLIGKLEQAKRISAEAGYRIFTPSPDYFTHEHQFIAASNDTRAKGIFRIWIHLNKLWIEFMPFYDNEEHAANIAKRLKQSFTNEDIIQRWVASVPEQNCDGSTARGIRFVC